MDDFCSNCGMYDDGCVCALPIIDDSNIPDMEPVQHKRMLIGATTGRKFKAYRNPYQDAACYRKGGFRAQPRTYSYADEQAEPTQPSRPGSVPAWRHIPYC
jgi:hypothetical protein